MCDFVNSFLSSLEGIIIDLDDQKNELERLTNELDNVNKVLNYVDNDIKNFDKYPEQEYIYQNLASLDSDQQTYQAMVYLVSNNNDNIKRLPQYEAATKYLQKVIDYFSVNQVNLTTLKEKCEEDYQYKSTAKKYYDLFKGDEIVVLDQTEFIELLNSLVLDNDTKINILCYVIKSNVNYYTNDLDEALEVDREQDLMKVHEIIHQNKNLLSDEYTEFMKKVTNLVNLSLNIKDLVNDKNLTKISIRNLILGKTIWLTEKITQNYKSCEFGLVSKYIKEYDELMDIKEKVMHINDKDEIIKIIKGGY